MSARVLPVGPMEALPKGVKVLPMLVQWLWLSLRYRSLTLPSSANPGITTGGLVGEGKMEYFGIMGPRAWRSTAVTRCIEAQGASSLADAEKAIREAGLTYPVVVKPDLGWCGFGVRRIDDAAAMCDYLAAFPAGEHVVIQEWLQAPGEAGIFYMRHPDEPRGRVIGVVLRHFPRVTGDGVRTVSQLMAADVRARRLGSDGQSEACCDPARVPGANEVVRIAHVGSTRVGGAYEDGGAWITPELSAAVDEIARDMRDFHAGRFDVKYTDLEGLARGEFTILEVNGAGSEAVHAWDPSLTLREAYAIVFGKQRLLFRIADAMRCRGHAPCGWWPLARHHLRQQALIRRYPRSN
ncbi:MAG: hypothetical protein ACJ8GO_18690 [Ramlibacter sp.]